MTYDLMLQCPLRRVFPTWLANGRPGPHLRSSTVVRDGGNTPWRDGHVPKRCGLFRIYGLAVMCGMHYARSLSVFITGRLSSLHSAASPIRENGRSDRDGRLPKTPRYSPLRLHRSSKAGQRHRRQRPSRCSLSGPSYLPSKHPRALQRIS